MAGLGPYLVKRAIQAAITIFVVTSIIWALFEAMPGDPTDAFYANPNYKAEDIANMAVSFGLADKHVETLTAKAFTPVPASQIPNSNQQYSYFYTVLSFNQNPRAVSMTLNESYEYGNKTVQYGIYVFSSSEKVPLDKIYLKNSSNAEVPSQYKYHWTSYDKLGNSIQSVGVLPKKYVYVLIEIPLKDVQISPQLKIALLYVTDKPLYERYVFFLKDMFTLNFGISSIYHEPVWTILEQRVPRTLLWFGLATLITYAIGIPLGTYIAWRRGGAAEGAVIGFSLFFYNMPSFWLALVFLWIFSYSLGWTPISGFASEGYTGPGSTCAQLGICPGNPFYSIVDYGWHLILPLTVIVLLGVAGVILLQRTSMLETLGEDYILTAKAKGLPEKVVRNKHARRNAMLPIITSFVLSLAYAIGGAVILEQIFSYYGVGYTYLQALMGQDFFLAGATLYIISLLVIFGNVLADVLYGILDPRVRLQ